MFGGIVHRLLGNPVKVHRRFRVLHQNAAHVIKGNRDAGQARGGAGQFVQRHRQTGSIHLHGEDAPGQITHEQTRGAGQFAEMLGLGCFRAPVLAQVIGQKGRPIADGGELRTEAVMQIAPDALLFALARPQDLPFQ